MVSISKILEDYLKGKLLFEDRERFELLLSENNSIVEKLLTESDYNYNTLVNIVKLAKENVLYRAQLSA